MTATGRAVKRRKRRVEESRKGSVDIAQLGRLEGTAVVIDGCRVALEFTRPYFGGRRAWFTCPRCGARRRILYFLDPLGCSTCLKLSYESRQLHRKKSYKPTEEERKCLLRAKRLHKRLKQILHQEHHVA